MLAILHVLIDGYCLILLARSIASWVAPDSDHPFVRFLESATEPVLAPVREKVGVVGGLDVAPLLVFFALRLLRAFL